MKGILLAGGTGSRLGVLTKISNKHLLPVYNKPMIYYPIQTLVDSGIRDILIVCGGNAAGEFLRILGNGEEFGLKHLSYTYQSEPAGIAHALGLAEYWADNEPICVMLGDNLVGNPFPESIKYFEENPQGARIFVTKTQHPERYGVVELNNGKIVNIVEKPAKPKSDTIAIGVYLYDTTVWDKIRSLKPSQRQELEITDLNNMYLQEGKLEANLLPGWWRDAGESLEGYMETCIHVYNMRNQHGTL